VAIRRLYCSSSRGTPIPPSSSQSVGGPNGFCGGGGGQPMVNLNELPPSSPSPLPSIIHLFLPQPTVILRFSVFPLPFLFFLHLIAQLSLPTLPPFPVHDTKSANPFPQLCSAPTHPWPCITPEGVGGGFLD